MQYRRERWLASDADFVDVDWLDAPAGATLLVLFHGLEGSSRSHYAQAFAAYARQQEHSYVVPHFRGCSGELNRGPRAYHSGDFEEIGWILSRLRERHTGPILAIGISLGGNALLRWAEEMGGQASRFVSAVASVSAPLDLAASGRAIGRGFNRQVYTRMFLASMKPKALKKLAQYPGLFDLGAMQAARDLYDFDNVFTAPLHGFRNTEDYWERAPALPQFPSIRLPTLLVNARHDPFVPAAILPDQQRVGDYIRLGQPGQGGHVGVATVGPPGALRWLPEAAGA